MGLDFVSIDYTYFTHNGVFMMSAVQLNFLAAPILLFLITRSIDDWNSDSDMPPIIVHMGILGSLYCLSISLTQIVAMVSLVALVFLSEAPVWQAIALIFAGLVVGKIGSDLERKVMAVKLLIMNAISPGLMAGGLWCLGLSAWGRW